jgi:hypothetical protein
MNLGRTPSVIALYHLEYESLDFRIDRRPSALPCSGFTLPIESESPLVLAHNGIRLNNQDRATPTRPNAR